MNSTIPEIDADSVKRMIDSSRQSKGSAVIDISFSNVKNNGTIEEVLAYLTVVKRKNGWIMRIEPKMNIKDTNKTGKLDENNIRVNEVKIEMKKSNTDNNEDLGFLMSIFDFLTWP